MNKLEQIKSKILSGIELERWLTIVRFKNQKIVFTNGCFDILHKGHIQYLAEASELGDYLVIGLNTDTSVKKLKGNGRPYLDQESRVLILASLKFVAAIVFFNEETPLELIKQIQPDILVKGADYRSGEIVGSDFVKQYGGEVVTLDLVEGYSSTEVINKINAGS